MELKKIISHHPQVLNNIAMFKGILLDTYNQPENRGKINLILNAYEIHITDEIAQNDLDDVFVERMKKKLVSTYSVTESAAEWAVKTWCSEYGNGILNKEIHFAIIAANNEVEKTTTSNTIPVIKNSKQLILENETLYEGETFAGIPHGYGKAKYINGDIYEGYWDRGLRSGLGTLIYQNGAQWSGEFKDNEIWNGNGYGYSSNATYEGEWKEGKQNGKGNLVWNEGGEWVGEFKNDKRWNGTGIERYKKTFYDGPLVEGKRCGFGVHRYTDRIYEGKWQNDKKHGQGKLLWTKGGEWIGEFKNGKHWTGNGVIRYQSGVFFDGPLVEGKRCGFGIYHYTDAVYEGEWQNDERNGQGKLVWNDGGEWLGEFKNDKRWNGNGVVRYQNGVFYDGSLVEGKRCGFGTHHYTDAVYEGEWQNDERNGQGKLVWNDGGEWLGEFKNDKRWNGQGIERYKDDEYYEGTMADGERNGFGKYVWNDGAVYEGEWKHGKRNGQGKLIRKNGDVLEGKFVNDSLFRGAEYLKSQNKTRFFSNGYESSTLVGDHRISIMEPTPELSKIASWIAFIITTLFYLLAIHLFKSNYPEYTFNNPFNFYSAFPFIVPITHAFFSGWLGTINKVKDFFKTMSMCARISFFIILFVYLILGFSILFRDLGDKEVFNAVKGIGLWCTRIDWAITSLCLLIERTPQNNN